jgi:hypothetical protein
MMDSIRDQQFNVDANNYNEVSEKHYDETTNLFWFDKFIVMAGTLIRK